MFKIFIYKSVQVVLISFNYYMVALKVIVLDCSHKTNIKIFLIILWKCELFFSTLFFYSKRVPITPPGKTPSQGTLTDEQVNLYNVY